MLVLLALSLLLIPSVLSSSGTSFAVTFSAINNDQVTGTCNAYVNGLQDTEVTLRTAIDGVQTYSLVANTTLKFTFSPALYRTQVGVDNNVIYISSDLDVTVSLSNTASTNDMEMILAIPEFTGTNEYLIVVPATASPDLCTAGTTLSFLTVAAYDNGTDVDIYEIVDGQYILRNNTELNTFQSNTERNTNTDSEFTGFKVVANKPVSVTSGNACGNLNSVETGSSGLIWSSMPNVQEIGKYYISPKMFFFSQKQYKLRVLAVNDNTLVVFERSDISVTLNLGEYVDLEVTDYISEVVNCSSACLVTQFGYNQVVSSPLFMTVLPSTNRFVNSTQFTTSNANMGDLIFVILLSGDPDAAGFQLDDRQLSTWDSEGDISWGLDTLTGSRETRHYAEADVPFSMLVFGYIEGSTKGYGFNAAFTALTDDPEEPPPDTKTPQFEITMTGSFSSTSGEDFSIDCTGQYVQALNDVALARIPEVNRQIGDTLCMDYSLADMDLMSVSTVLQSNANKGDTKLWFMMGVSTTTLTPHDVEDCAQEIDTYLMDHMNWPNPILPTEPDCPGVAFASPNFNNSGNFWICNNNKETLDNSLKYRFIHSGAYTSSDGLDISLDCLSGYSSSFQASTLDQFQAVNGMIVSGELCADSGVTMEYYTANMANQGSQGETYQTYVFLTGEDTGSAELYSCVDSVSAYLSPHSNWPDPIIRAPSGCPALMFSPNVFQEDLQEWICVQETP